MTQKYLILAIHSFYSSKLEDFTVLGLIDNGIQKNPEK